MFFTYWLTQAEWIEEHIAAMSLRQKLAQLIVTAAYLDGWRDNHEHVLSLIAKEQIGGILFLGKNTISVQVQKTIEFQQLSSIPLLIVQDCEWGLGMRLTDSLSFPKARFLGAAHDELLIYKVAKEIGRQCAVMGIHINCAPVADVDTNPYNPVIGVRSFGSNPQKVARCSELFMKGLQDVGIIACAKHFPGHGDTTQDSHLELPLIVHDRARLNEVELYPFNYLIDRGVQAIMIGHLQVPALDSAFSTPATCSYSIVNNLLRNELGFEGLIITDALDMAGINKDPIVASVEALCAGNDILLHPLYISELLDALEVIVASGRISEEEIDKRVKRVLMIKKKLIIENGIYLPQRDQLSTLTDDQAKELCIYAHSSVSHV
jgi:beta-N-acetylhexosaminidase